MSWASRARRIALLLRLELMEVMRGGGTRLALALLVAAGALGLLHGRSVVQRQRSAIAEAPRLQREQHRGVLANLSGKELAGDQLYYLFFHTAHEPSPWAAFSVGQRDLQPFNLKVRLLALQGQLHDSEVSNPLLAVLGNLDAAFVLVLAGPLVVILLCYDVLSAEQERGTWDLVRSQPSSAGVVLARRLGIRGALALAPLGIVLALALPVLGVRLDGTAGSVLALTTLYVGVWVAAAALVAGLGRSSEFNLLALVGLWVVWCVLGPSLVQVAAASRFPMSEPLELAVRQRDGYHAAWDRPLAETMARFYGHYPEWRSWPVPTDTYSNAWYYAMQQRGDDEAAPAAARYFEALERRRAFVARTSLLFPPAAFQLGLDEVARTGLSSHLGYLASVAAFHEELKRFFLPVIFSVKTVEEVAWSEAPVHGYRDQRPARLGGPAGALAAALATVGLASVFLLRRHLGRSPR